VRPADVQALFLRRFEDLYPQLAFRAMRRFPARGEAGERFTLRVAVGRAATELELNCAILSDGALDPVEAWIEQQAAIPSPGLAPVAKSSAGVPHILVVVAPLVDAQARHLLQEQGIGYLDLNGNAYLETPNVYVQIGGRAKKAPPRQPFRSPFQGKGERVVRRLLLQPKKHWTMRQLARAAEVSLGLTSTVTSSLAEMGAVTKERSGLDLFDPRRLLDAWSRSYDLRNNTLATYRSALSPEEIQRTLITERANLRHRYALTLWSAAQVRLPKVVHKTAYVALYWMDGVDELVDGLHLDAEQGSTHVFCFQPYDDALLWGMEALNGLYVVHPLQLYLDLASGDDSEVQLAQRVRETLLGW
jgi:hypothetical protein